MIKAIKITEKCEVTCISEEDEPLKDGEVLYGYREIYYPTYYEALVHALIDYEDNFDINKVMSCNDSFAGECLCSEIVGIEFSDRYTEEYMKQFIDEIYRRL